MGNWTWSSYMACTALMLIAIAANAAITSKIVKNSRDKKKLEDGNISME